MKRIITLLICIILVISFTGCANEPSNNISFKIGVVDGAPALSVVNISNGFLYQSSDTEYRTDIEIVANANSVVAGLTNGTFDMAIIPLNLASKLYNQSKNLSIKLASVNIFGVLYMVGKNQIDNLEELKGKVVYSVGAGGTPELVFKHILANNGIKYADGDQVLSVDTVYFNAVSEAKFVISALNNGMTEYAILGEPAVTQVNAKTGTKVVLDLQAEWSKLHGGKFVQAGLAMKSSVYEHSEYVNVLVDKLGLNRQYLYDNVSSIKDILVSKGSSLTIDFSEDILSRCYIGSTKAINEKDNIENFLKALLEFDATSIGGKLPENDFYL